MTIKQSFSCPLLFGLAVKIHDKKNWVNGLSLFKLLLKNSLKQTRYTIQYDEFGTQHAKLN